MSGTARKVSALLGSDLLSLLDGLDGKTVQSVRVVRINRVQCVERKGLVTEIKRYNSGVTVLVSGWWMKRHSA